MNEEIKHSCETCEHCNDIGIEHCVCCDNHLCNWQEAGWHIEDRLSKEIAVLKAQLAKSISKEAFQKIQKENEQLKEALDEFGSHKESCAYIQQLNAQVIAECDCGYEKALKGE